MIEYHTATLPTPTIFDLPQFLAGSSLAWGVFEDRFGRVRRRFQVKFDGHWQDQTFLLDEQIIYEDGVLERRVWRISPSTGRVFSAVTEDCIGVAQGTIRESAIEMRYKFRLRLKTKSIVVRLEDHFYRLGEDVAVSRARVFKFGVRVGDVSLFILRGKAA